MKFRKHAFAHRKVKVDGICVFLDDDRNLMNGEKIVFGNAFQASVVRDIDERGIYGTVLPNYSRHFEQFIGKTLGADSMLIERRFIVGVSPSHVFYMLEGEMKKRASGARQFFNWANRDKIKIIEK